MYFMRRYVEKIAYSLIACVVVWDLCLDSLGIMEFIRNEHHKSFCERDSEVPF